MSDLANPIQHCLFVEYPVMTCLIAVVLHVYCRKVPLSEGRVHNGTLECAYHGWEFDGSGKPVSIPQVSCQTSTSLKRGAAALTTSQLQYTPMHSRIYITCVLPTALQKIPMIEHRTILSECTHYIGEMIHYYSTQSLVCLLSQFCSLQIGHSDKMAEKNACNNSRACCSTFPTQVRQGLVWVWADSAPGAYLDSAMQVPALCPEYQRFEGKGILACVFHPDFA